MSVQSLARFTVRHGSETLLDQPGTLALLDFGSAVMHVDPRRLRVPLAPIGSAPCEIWQVDAPVTCGVHGSLRWSAGGGWLFATMEMREGEVGIEAAAERVYEELCGFIAARAERHLLRVWNYLHAINTGDGDDERYRRFCVGRARGLAAHGIQRYPAATAIGHRDAPGLLQVYALCATAPGAPLENPRQVSAWRYPREHGPTPPSFARAMLLPDGGLAISGTAAIVGHASRHDRDLAAQVEETFVNLDALLAAANLHAFGAHSPLKIYLRHAEDADAVQSSLAKHLDFAAPRVLLSGEICRRELLVEIDGWSNLPA